MIFFNPGELVQLRADLAYKPVMLVKKVVRFRGTGESNNLVGIACLWFTAGGLYQEQVFSSKDLEHATV